MSRPKDIFLEIHSSFSYLVSFINKVFMFKSNSLAMKRHALTFHTYMVLLILSEHLCLLKWFGHHRICPSHITLPGPVRAVPGLFTGPVGYVKHWRFPCGARTTPVRALHGVHVESCELFDQAIGVQPCQTVRDPKIDVTTRTPA